MVDVELVPPPSATTCDSLELADPASITESTTVVAIEDVSTTENETAEPRALAQVEFYFADSNLPYDKFMWSLHTATRNTGLEWVADVLRTSTELEVSEDGTKVRRRTEVQEPKGSFDRSVYAKGFGDEVPGLQRLLEQFFSKYGKVAAVRMRRVDGTKAFKGSVFTEFVEYKGVEAFLKADPQPSWDGKELLTMSKEAYVEMKIEEKGLKARRLSSGATGKKDTEKAKPEIFVEFLGAKLRVLEEDGGSIVPEDVPRVRGSALRFAGCGGEVLFDEIKRPLKEHFSRVPFVKFTRGDDAGLVGFDKALNEEDIAFVKEKIPTLNGKPILWELPEEEEEHTFSIERANAAAKRALGVTEGGNRGGRGGRAARGGRRERGGRSERGTRSGKRGGGIARTQNGKDEQAGEKRKRAVEADGGHDIGARGETVPTVVTAPAPKKAKTEGGES
ncbi:hypothetical protein B0F90DRAFT_1825756 [Multifurca ochricompacta]|uniref:RRM domain-containing protein n=1 Tax=Multifurca ochricompacta TaxID=376703 RepID=A0AAD4QIR2_9AGAM|nr:hypothetical protein B0F90DRAFT_1825756 [Multifurca ochricompacta]